ncbi:MAG: alpha/beta hydrolase, partial [Bacteroidota bacterium]
AEQGIASLRIDKRGVAQSAGAAVSEAELRFETYIEDAAAWLAWLKEKDDLGPVLMMGHSEGSLIGMAAAQKSSIVGFISLAGAGRPADEVLKTQLSAQGPQLTAITDPIIDSLKAGKTVEDVNPMLASLFRPSVQPYLISWFAYNPQEEIQALEIPVLIIQGTTDIQVAVSEAEFLKAAREDQADQTSYQVIEGMNHILKAAPADRTANMTTYSDPDLPLVPGLVDRIVAFVEEATQP